MDFNFCNFYILQKSAKKCLYLSSMCSEPSAIIQALAASSLEDVELIQFISGGQAASLAAKGHRRFRFKTFFMGGRGGPSRRRCSPGGQKGSRRPGKGLLGHQRGRRAARELKLMFDDARRVVG